MSWPKVLASRLRTLFQKSRAERELEAILVT